LDKTDHDRSIEKTLENGLRILCFLFFAFIGYMLTNYLH
jgi:hypothetical protein